MLALYAGTKSTTVLVPEQSSLQELLDLIERENPPAYQKLFAQKNVDEPFFRVMVNDNLIHPAEFTQSLHPNDIVTLLPGISGG